MELMSLISQLADNGLVDIAAVLVLVLYVRYSASETRREISKEIDDKLSKLKTDLEAPIGANRQAIDALRTQMQQEFTESRTYTDEQFNAARAFTEERFNGARTYSEQSHKGLRQEIIAARAHTDKAHQETRQEIYATRTYSEQSHKEILLHLIEVRERLANIAGRLGAPTPRMSAVSPPL